jgi:branched-chain amino acid transport system permease protein
VTERLHDSPSSHVIQPRLPIWAINLGLTLLIAAMWPVGWLLQENMDAYYLRVIVLVGFNIILATSLNLINGITGQFSLGHAGFMAVGAYTTGIIMRHHNPTGVGGEITFFGMLIASGLLAAVAGLIVGIPALRLRGDYLAIATLGFGEIIYTIINATDHVGRYEVGGASGLHGIPQYTNFFWTYACVIVCVVCVWRIAYSTKGLAFRAVREDEIAAAAMGVDTTFHKVAAFSIGAFWAGVAGGLLACYDQNLDPGSFRFMRSIEIVAMVVLGGAGSVTGSIFAAIVLTCLPEMLRFIADWRMVVYSLILIFMMLFRPTGLLGSKEVWWTRRRQLKREQRGFDVIPSGR